MYKLNGTLGFTLRKENISCSGHFISALVQEPALSDGRLNIGDEVVKVYYYKHINRSNYRFDI